MAAGGAQRTPRPYVEQDLRKLGLAEASGHLPWGAGGEGSASPSHPLPALSLDSACPQQRLRRALPGPETTGLSPQEILIGRGSRLGNSA